ncbi:hypothetical protein [Acinetobacter pittii]|uniref:Uncharacterized protein n=1 Tax=Acinetobacter pittii TaxID=48296 RepID=A0A429K206_ACIPI|nr:hypothetical protein [Acinetobacter pittii]HEM6651504.1 hypothetical protein [Acinetobacter baumannii]KQE17069.1 hypothetical protein APD36_16485 [Acinetobacter pittii]KRI47691.1 hypothetical protein APC42_10065 [Acinetobacter pittii]RSO51587.1 hypothetical protein EA758_14895 [Acinetobacter pittii]RSO57856.1 hypothetical protein EA752_14650 [Acinetobacter pittii]
MNTESNLAQHPCENKCTKFEGEQCKTCLIQDIEKKEFNLGLAPDSEYVKCQFVEGDFVVFMPHIVYDGVYQIDAFQPAEYYWLTNGQLAHKTDIRLATDIEIQAKERTPADVLKHLNRVNKAKREVS